MRNKKGGSAVNGKIPFLSPMDIKSQNGAEPWEPPIFLRFFCK